jgi:hypothetical protein
MDMLNYRISMLKKIQIYNLILLHYPIIELAIIYITYHLYDIQLKIISKNYQESSIQYTQKFIIKQYMVINILILVKIY